MLLGPVVDVALQAPPLGVVGVDDASARRLEVVGQRRQVVGTPRQLGAQPSTAKDQARLGREAGEQALLDRRQRLVAVLLQAQDAEPRAVERDVQRAQAGLRRASSPCCSGPDSWGQAAASSGSSSTTSQTWAHLAPVPSASRRAIRSGSSACVAGARSRR